MGPCLEEVDVDVTSAGCDKPDHLTSKTKEDGEMTRFTVGGHVHGMRVQQHYIYSEVR